MTANYFQIKLDSIKKIRDFVELTTSIPNIVDVIRGRFSVNGKSILGLFSLDLDKELKVIIYGDLSNDFKHKISMFEVN